MATTVMEELKTFFTADVSGFTRGTEKVQEAIRKTTAAERAANRETKRFADERKRLGETITSSIANPAAGASRAAEGLLSKLKGLGPVGIAAAVALGAAGKVMRDIRRDAEASAERIAALNDEFRKTTNSNTFASTGEGTGGLLARLRESEDLRKKGREANEARDPYGFGTSFGGRASTVATKLAQPLVNLANDPFGIDKEEREKLQMDLATKTAVSQEREIRMKISEGIRADLSMVRDRLSGDRADAEILGLQLARTRAIKEAEQNSKYISPADRQRIAAGFDLQIKAAREQQEADSKRFMQSAAALGLQSSTLTTLQKQVKAQYAVIAAAKDELATRTMITAERRRELQLTIMGPQGELRNERREKMFGKTEGQIRKELLQEKKTRKKVEKFDAKQDRNDGLVDIHRGMNDEILSGVDPLTGERRKPSAGYRPPTRLETGGLETGNLRTMDDRTPSPFDDNMPAARDPAVRLMNPSGSGFGNPADRLNNPEGSGFGNPTDRLNRGRAGHPFDRLNRGRAGHPFDPDIMRGPQASSHFSGGASMAAAAQVAVLNSHTPFLQYLPKIAAMMDKMGLG